MENTKTQKIINITAISLLVYIAFIKGSKIDPMNLFFGKNVNQQMRTQPVDKSKLVQPDKKEARPGFRSNSE